MKLNLTDSQCLALLNHHKIGINNAEIPQATLYALVREAFALGHDCDVMRAKFKKEKS